MKAAQLWLFMGPHPKGKMQTTSAMFSYHPCTQNLCISVQSSPHAVAEQLVTCSEPLLYRYDRNCEGEVDVKASNFWCVCTYYLLGNPFTHSMMKTGHAQRDDIKILGHCSESICLNVCLCVQSGAISKFPRCPVSAYCVYTEIG